MSPRRAKLAALLISTALAAGVAEVGLRVAGVSYPNFYQPHPVRGWELRPNAEGRWKKEGDAEVEINSRGMRDREVAVPKPPGTVRIALLGDSCTEALQVPVEKTFARLLERELASCPAVAGRKVETLNFGVAGYGTIQELLSLREQAWPLEPDAVVLAFYSGNDVRNNSQPLDQDPTRPYVREEGGRYRLDTSFRDTSGYRLRRSAPGRLLYAVFNHSRLLELGKQGKSTVDGWIGSLRARRHEEGEALQELGLDNAVYWPPKDPLWGDAWRITEAMLRTMRDESAAHRKPFGVVSLTTGMQVHPDPKVRQEFMKKLGVDTLFYPDERLAAFGRAERIPTLTLAQPLAREAQERKVFLHGFPNTAPGEGHWNEQGHAAAAPLLADWICRELLH